MLLHLLFSTWLFVAPDSTRELANVEVRVLEQNRTRLSSPDAFNLLKSKDIQPIHGNSFATALNAQAGVRLEERSPGSYRVAIRGSSLRAPFGVRNVKIYWNQIPFTDAGNNSYLAILEPDMMDQLIILKGPSGGLYGAGTGGSMLFQGPILGQKKLEHQEIVNSLGGYKQTWDIQHSGHRVYASFWQQPGARDWSAMKKQVLTHEYQKNFGINGSLQITSYYADVAYQTPGGLTRAQYNTNPFQARPAAGIFLSAAAQQATFKLKSFGTGVNLTNSWNGNWGYSLANSIQVNKVENPTIRNYEIRHEPNVSSRGVIHYQKNASSIDFGYEFQIGQFDSQTFGNRKGIKDTLQTSQNTNIQSGNLFVQWDYQINPNWNSTVSLSANGYWTQYIGNEQNVTPRLAIVRKLGNRQRLVFKIASGYSPPSIAEMRPSTGIINTNLKAEKGWNKEISWRGNYTNFEWDINAYQFDLDETIVIRRAADGSDYFVNTGSTTQQGIELGYQINLGKKLTLRNSESIQNFRFNQYKSGTKDYSGNRLTGTSPFQHASVIQWELSPKLTWTGQFLFTDFMYLNDANTDVLPSSRVWNSKIQYQRKHWEIYLAAENLFNELYVSGPDLNAVGSRYYNAAPGRYFQTGLKIKLN
jgi:iron complex outermembrane receptor protein